MPTKKLLGFFGCLVHLTSKTLVVSLTIGAVFCQLQVTFFDNSGNLGNYTIFESLGGAGMGVGGDTF